MSSLFTRYIKNSSWVLAGNVVARGFGLLTVATVARLLGPTGFGTYTLTVASSDSFSQMADLGTSVVVQRTYAAHQTTVPAITGYRFAGAIWLFMLFYGCLLATFSLTAGTAFVNHVLPDSIRNDAFLLIALSFTSRLNQFILVPLTGLQQFRKLSYRNTLNAVIVLGAVGAGAWLQGVNGALVGLLAANSLSMLLTGYWLWQEHKHYAITVHWLGGFRAIPGLLKQGFLLYMGNTLSGAIYNLVLVGLVIQYVPLTDYSYIRVGLSLASLVGVFVTALQPVTLSALADSTSVTHHTQLKSLTIRVIFCLVLTGTLWLIILNDVVVAIMFGKSYLNGMPVIASMLVITVIQTMGQFYVSFLIAKGQGNFIGLISVGTVTLSITLAYWLIPTLGVWGYIISFGSGYLTGMLLAFWKEITTTSYGDRTKLFVVFGATFVLLNSALLITRADDPALRAALCLGLTIPVAVGWYYFILHAAERTLIVSFLRKFYRN